jgi:SAM-dependent methyltransferase
MGLRHVKRTYEELGDSDPLYAVLSFKEARGNKWDPEVFFERGRREIDTAMAHLNRLGLELRTGRALDFGCGVGRLTQALCDVFDEAVGVDISSSMVAAAERYNRHGERCRYRVNTTADLAQFEDEGFDFVYSNIALQHSPPDASGRYIAEFFRILKPQGIALFQIPSGPRHDPGTWGARWYALRRGPLRRLWKRLRGKAPVEIHYLNRGVVEEIIAQSGGCLVDVMQEGSVRRSRVSLMYTAVKDAG